MLSAGQLGIAHDARGNLSTSGTSTYAYNADNLMVSTGGSAPAATLAYDPMGRLAQSVGAGVTTRFAYDGASLIAEYNASNQLLRRYVHGPGSDEPILWYEGSGTSDRRFLMRDERGSIVSVANAAGTVLSINSYDEYGIPASGNLGRFQYTGQTWLPELGMYYYKARLYSPTLGRFMQSDPIGYADGMNMYAYVGGDPINYVDPTGLFGEGFLEPNKIPTPEECKNNPNTPGCDDIVVNGFSCSSVKNKYAPICMGGINLGFGSGMIDLGPLFTFVDINEIRTLHDCAVDQVAAGVEANGGSVVREVTFNTPDGRWARFDLVTRDPNGRPIGVIEVKTVGGYLQDLGDLALDALFRRSQPAVAAAIRNGTAIPRGANAIRAGLTVGQPLGRPMSVEIIPFLRELTGGVCPM